MTLCRQIVSIAALAFLSGVLPGCAALAGVSTSTVPAGGSSPGAPPRDCRARGSGLFSLPDRYCSPGALNPVVTQGTIHETICRPGYTRTIRPPESVTGPEKRVVMRAYGIRGSTHGYELDHIVSLELGGAANSYHNYWPEPDYPGTGHGFYPNPKDRLEGALKRLVCSGKVTLAAAQNDIATNWVTAYRRLG